MKQVLPVLLSAGLLLPGTLLHAQPPESSKERKNLFKINLSSIAINHYAFQYERVTRKKQSFAIGFGFSPNVDLPFKNTLSDQFGDNADAVRAIETTKFTKITVTPEYRFYFGKKAPQGFYLALFARYSNMKISQDYTFTPSNGSLHNAHITGKINGIGGGVLAGAQWLLGKQQRISIDWWIAGPFIGSMNGDLVGTDPKMNELTAQDRADLENDIESVDIPLWDVDATVGANSVDVKLKGAFYGVRFLGISLGIKF
jgi:hypothetical protein